MLVFLTGANGFVGSPYRTRLQTCTDFQVGRHVIEALKAAGHEVLALAHHDKAAATVSALGAQVHSGSLDDIESLKAGAAKADAVVHCGFNHDFTKHEEACATDLAATKAMIEVLGKDKPFIGTSSPLWVTEDGVFVEDMSIEGRQMKTPRGHAELAVKAKGAEGYRTAVLRLPPTVHGENDPNFIPLIISKSKEARHIGYAGDGSQKWSAVHVRDAARLYVITLEGLADGSIPPGQTLHASENSGHSTKDISEAIADKLKIDIGSITPQQSVERYTPFIGGLWCGNVVMQSDITRNVAGWQPKENTLIEDLKTDIYFK